MHRILLRQIVIDVPTEQFQATQTFWSSALLATSRQLEDHPEFTALEQLASTAQIGLQDIGSTPARVHLDIETDDIEAEVVRLSKLGATEFRRHDDWITMTDPAGLQFCLIPPESPQFSEHARDVG
ncbi:MAG: hypothetical protein M3Z00_03110 [Actinomycetota bacterium]|nr:hypothetical protein [Actinomycetota bacterium]